MGYIQPASALREAYLNANEVIQASGINPLQYNPTYQVLRFEKLLQSGNNSYQFNLRANPGSDRPLEKKLQQNDVLVVESIGLYVTRQDTDNRRYGNFALHSYPNANIFPGVLAPGVPEVGALETIWNGKLTLQSGNNVRLNDSGTEIFRYAPQTQDDTTDIDEFNLRSTQVPVQPMYVLNGQQENLAKLVLGDGNIANIAGGIDASGNALDPVLNNVLVLIITGVIYNNAAEPIIRQLAQGGGSSVGR